MNAPQTPSYPLVTFVILGFRQEQFIRQAIEGALAQEYPALEIILSDDCSSDATFSIMQEIAASYSGPHQLVVRQNEVNLGLAGHVNALFTLARGDYIVLAAGDDISHPQRTATSIDILRAHPNAGEVIFSAENINDAGDVTGRSMMTNEPLIVQSDATLLGWQHKTLGAGRTIRKQVFTKFGPLAADCPTEDTPFLLRSVLMGGSLLSNQTLLQYRHHDSNLSAAAGLARMNIDAIHDQYRRDLAVAVDTDLISAQMSDTFENWMQQDKTIRALRLKLMRGEKLELGERWTMIKLPAFSPKQKLRGLLKF